MASNQDGVVPEETAGVRPTHEDPPDLPEPPKVDRRLEFHPTQVAGLVMVGIMPLLSMFGLFGIGRGTAQDAGGPVAFRLEYPTVQRLKVRQPLRMHVTNTSSQVVDAVELRVERDYLTAFADVAFTPDPEDIDAEEYVFLLEDLQPGETRVVSGEMQATDYWRHEATARWRALDASGAEVDSGQVEFGTFVWP